MEPMHEQGRIFSVLMKPEKVIFVVAPKKQKKIENINLFTYCVTRGIIYMLFHTITKTELLCIFTRVIT